MAVAGVGVVCGLGSSLQELSDGLHGHCVGTRLDSNAIWRPAIAPAGGCPEVVGFRDDRKVAYLFEAVRQALEGAPDVPDYRRGVFMGTGLSSVTPTELREDVYAHVVDGRVDRHSATADLTKSGVAPWRHMPARATGAVARHWGATGPCLTTFSACAAGAEAIAEGARAIARGEIDVALAGGHDAMGHPLGMLSFQVLGALSDSAARPFDRRRDGFVLGEGAAVLRLEPVESCSRPLAYILGAGSSIDAWGVTAPHPEGLGAEASMRRALGDAGLRIEDVDWVNAHATATPVGDRAEAAAIHRVFGPGVTVSSLKGALGHVLAAAGAVEAAATIAAIGCQFTPGTVGCEEPDGLDIRVLREPRARAPRITVSNSFGFGGQNVSLVIADPAWEG